MLGIPNGVSKTAKNVAIDTLEWMKGIGAFKNTVIRPLESVVKIAEHLGKQHWVPSVLRTYAHLTPQAKTLVVGAETVYKTRGIYKAIDNFFRPEPEVRKYVIRDITTNKTGIGFYRTTNFENILEIFSSTADWAYSALESREFVSSTKHETLTDWTGRVLYLAGFATEGLFLYKACYEKVSLSGVKGLSGPVVKQEIIRSVMRVALSALFMAYDMIRITENKGYKSSWLSEAKFWTPMAINFMIPLATHYSSVIWTDPLLKKA